MAYYRTCKFLLVYCAMFVSYEGENRRAGSAEDLHNATPIEPTALQNSLTTEYHKAQIIANKGTKVDLPDIKFTFNLSDSDKISAMDIPQRSSSTRTAITTTKRTRHRSSGGNNSDTKFPVSSKPASNTTIPYVTLSTPYLKEHLARDQITEEEPFGGPLLGLSEEDDAGLHRVYIGGLFELMDTPGIVAYGRSELAAAKLAIRHVNKRGILPGYKLHMVYNDTKVSTVFIVTASKHCDHCLC